MIALIYARLSDRDSKEDRERTEGGLSGSVATQLREAREWVTARGHRIGGEFYDDGISGGTMDPPGMVALLREVRRLGALCYVVVKDGYRFGRDTDFIGERRATIRRAGSSVVYWSEENDAPVVRIVKSALGEEYLRKCRDEANRILPARARAGKRNGGVPPLGYTADGDGWTLDPEAVAPMVRAFELAAEGLTVQDIAATIGMRPATLFWRLHNPIYAGGVAWNRTHHTVSASGRVWGKPRPREEWIVAWGAAPAAVSRETWDRVQAMIHSRRKDRGGRKKKGPLSGLLLCGACGARMWVTTGFRSREGWVDCYGCRACRAIGAISTRGWVPRIIARIGEAVTDAWIEAAAARIVAAYETGHARGTIDAEIRRLERARERLLDAIEDPAAGDVKALAARLRACETSLAEARERVDEAPAAPTLAETRSALHALRSATTAAITAETAGRFLQRWVDALRVRPTREAVEINLRLPHSPTRGECSEVVVWRLQA